MSYVKKQLRFPKTDYARSIEKDQQYIDMLERFIQAAENEIQSGHLNKLQSTRLKIEVYESRVKLDTQKTLLKDKTDHFMNDFLPGYQQKIENMNGLWGATVQAITGRFDEILGYDNGAEPAMKKQMYDKAVDILETSKDENLKLLFAYFCEYDAMVNQMKENEEVKLSYFELFLKFMK